MQIRHKIAVLGMAMGIAISGIGAELPEGVTHFGDIDINALIQTNAAREIQKSIDTLSETIPNMVKEGISSATLKVENQNVYTYVTTNATIVSTKENLGPTLGAASGGVAFDYYETNSVYFIDDVVPTLKFFAPYRRQAFWPNQITAVEIGDETQVLRTYFMQVDGNLAVKNPSNIKFMSTLDRNAPYDQGRSLTLQDYLDAFNPVFVPETLKMFQTNRSDYSVGTMTVHNDLSVKNKEDGNIFSVTEKEANFMDSLVVKADVGPYLYYEGAKNDEGVVTNFYGFAKTNAEVEVNGNMHVSDSIGVSSNVFVWGNLIINGWDKLYVKQGKETDVNAYHGFRESLGAYFEELAAPLIAATNDFWNSDRFIEVERAPNETDHSKPIWYHWVEKMGNTTANFSTYEGIIKVKDKCNFRIDTTIIRHVYKDQSNTWRIMLEDNGKFTSNKFIFDASKVATTSSSGSGSPVTNYVDVGTFNFKGMGGDTGYEGEFETIYSNVEPIERTEAILRTETYEYENWIWDEELGYYILDPDQPYITETYEWWDEYTFDMVWAIPPGTCWEFDFKKVGETAMRVNVQQIYKTQPYTGN